jgi:hypothetical protein
MWLDKVRMMGYEFEEYAIVEDGVMGESCVRLLLLAML